MDISKNGAKIIAIIPSRVPDHFELALTQAGDKGRACHVAWRRGKIIGVQFVHDRSPINLMHSLGDPL